MRWKHGAPFVVALAALAPAGGSVAHAAPAPEIQVNTVHFQSWSIPVGTSFNYMGTLIGVPYFIDYTITNTGEPGSQLELSNVTVPSGFTVVQAPAASVGAGQSTILRIRCDATSVGSFSGLLSFDTNDSDEDPFFFFVTCPVVGSGPPGLLEVWSPAAGGELADGGTLTLTAGATARVWAHDVLGAPAALQLLPVAVAPTGPQVSAWAPGNVAGSAIYTDLSCADDAGAPLTGTFQVTVEEAVLHMTVHFQLVCSGDLPVGGSDATPWAALAAVLVLVGGVLTIAARRPSRRPVLTD
jgi:hypothetical protein